MWPSNSTLGNLTKRTESIFPVNWRMKEVWHVTEFNTTQPWKEKRYQSTSQRGLTLKCYIRTKPHVKDDVFFGSVYVTWLREETYRDREQRLSGTGEWWWEADWLQMAWREELGAGVPWGESWEAQTPVSSDITKPCTFTKNHWIVCVQQVDFIVVKLHLNEAIFKKRLEHHKEWPRPRCLVRSSSVCSDRDSVT